MEFGIQIVSLVTVLFLWQPSHGCDRDGFIGQGRIERIKKAKIVLYGQIHTNHAEIVAPEQVNFYLKFTKYCVVRNSIVNSGLMELLKNTDLVIVDVYKYQDCIKEWHLLNGKNKLLLDVTK